MDFQKIEEHRINGRLKVHIPEKATHFVTRAGVIAFYLSKTMKGETLKFGKRKFVSIPLECACIEVEHCLRECNHSHEVLSLENSF